MVKGFKTSDRVVLAGSLVVVFDGSALACVGDATRATASTGKFRAGTESTTGSGWGICGLVALGVWELTYPTCFVAWYVLWAC